MDLAGFWQICEILSPRKLFYSSIREKKVLVEFLSSFFRTVSLLKNSSGFYNFELLIKTNYTDSVNTPSIFLLHPTIITININIRYLAIAKISLRKIVKISLSAKINPRKMSQNFTICESKFTQKLISLG